MEAILGQFDFRGKPVSCKSYGQGHINRTYLVVTDAGARYILQRISRIAFHDIPGLMENIVAVTDRMAEADGDPRKTLHPVPVRDGAPYYRDADGEYWRVYDFIEDSLCLQSARHAGDFYQSALGFGRFQQLLLDFPAETLHETIPDFHNTPDRYRKFRKALSDDPLGRASEVAAETDFVLSREEDASLLQNMRTGGALPVRVTHNDTKLNNVLLDASSGKALCVIDLDTVMPGLAAYDFGDSIRFGASTGAEDETDLSRISLDLELYETFTRGFTKACPSLLPEEIRSLAQGAKTMTLECGLRFLTDYIDGDRYFATARPAHNLDRARTQFKLVADMEQKWHEMNRITGAALT